MFTIAPDYRIPIFADGSVRFQIEKDGKPAFSVVHGVCGDDRDTQEANIAEGRAKLQEFVDLANAGHKLRTTFVR